MGVTPIDTYQWITGNQLPPLGSKYVSLIAEIFDVDENELFRLIDLDYMKALSGKTCVPGQIDFNDCPYCQKHLKELENK